MGAGRAPERMIWQTGQSVQSDDAGPGQTGAEYETAGVFLLAKFAS
jgi:hypothetical protein